MHINRYTRKILNIKYKDDVNIEIPKFNFIKDRPKRICNKNRLDMLALIPQNILVVETNKILTLWQPPKSRSIEINRFVDGNLAAQFFGLIFSEGQKCENTTDFYLSFSNNEIKLHQIVLDFLRKSLVNPELIQGYCYYNPNVNSDELKGYIRNFEDKTKLKVKLVKAERLGKFSFNTNVNSSLFGEIVLNSLNLLSNELINKNLTSFLYNFATTFVLNVIAGDGSLSISNSGILLQIADENNDRREVVTTVLKKFGLNPKNDGKLLVNCDITGLKRRFKILDLNILPEDKRIKLLASICHLKFFNLQMKRLEKLQKKEFFDNKYIRGLFFWNQNKTAKWLSVMKKREIIKVIGKKSYSTFYTLNENNEDFQNYLKWKATYSSIHENQNDL